MLVSYVIARSRLFIIRADLSRHYSPAMIMENLKLLLFMLKTSSNAVEVVHLQNFQYYGCEILVSIANPYPIHSFPLRTLCNNSFYISINSVVSIEMTSVANVNALAIRSSSIKPSHRSQYNSFKNSCSIPRVHSGTQIKRRIRGRQ